MKKKIILLFALLTVAVLLFAACNKPSVDDLQKINDLLKVNYSKVTVVVNTKTETAELNGNFTVTTNGSATTIQYKYDRISSFEVGADGSIGDVDGGFIETVEGEVVLRNGKIVAGDEIVDISLEELNVSGFSFKQAFFKNANLSGAKFEADVTNPQKFTGDESFTGTDMHVVVIRNTNTDTLTSIELTYTSDNGAEVKINYLFTK